MSYVGEPVLAPVVRKNIDTGTFRDAGYGDLPRLAQCIVLRRYDGFPGIWIVLSGERYYRLHEKFLRPSVRL